MWLFLHHFVVFFVHYLVVCLMIVITTAIVYLVSTISNSTLYQRSSYMSSSMCCFRTWQAWSTRHWLKGDCRPHRDMPSWRRCWKRQDSTLRTCQIFGPSRTSRSCPRWSSEPSPASSPSTYLPATSYHLLPTMQSAYRKKHSTETALLRVWSDILMAADVQQVTLLAMLDLSAAFDCVDHTILLQRLQIGAGLMDVVLEWIASFLSERTQQIGYRGELSSVQLVLFGVPQGSVLGPLLYVLYTAELFDVVASHRLRLHMYADDSQVYVSTPANNAAAAVVRTACIADIND